MILYVLAINIPIARGGKMGLLALLALLACIEKLCAIMNMVSIERDWVGRMYMYRHERLIMLDRLSVLPQKIKQH